MPEGSEAEASPESVCANHYICRSNDKSKSMEFMFTAAGVAIKEQLKRAICLAAL